MQNFQDIFETCVQSFINAFSICMTVPYVVIHLFLCCSTFPVTRVSASGGWGWGWVWIPHSMNLLDLPPTIKIYGPSWHPPPKNEASSPVIDK